MRKALMMVALCPVLVVAAPMTGAAQSADRPIPEWVRSNTLGFVLGAGLEVVAHEFENATATAGGGMSFTLGYGITPRVMVLANIEGAALEYGEGVGHADALLRFTFRSATSRVRPFITAGGSRRYYSLDDYRAYYGTGFFDYVEGKYEASGSGLTLGFGLGIFVKPELSIDLNLLATGGEYSRQVFQGNTLAASAAFAGTTRLRVGVLWSPGN